MSPHEKAGEKISFAVLKLRSPGATCHDEVGLESLTTMPRMTVVASNLQQLYRGPLHRVVHINIKLRGSHAAVTSERH